MSRAGRHKMQSSCYHGYKGKNNMKSLRTSDTKGTNQNAEYFSEPIAEVQIHIRQTILNEGETGQKGISQDSQCNSK